MEYIIKANFENDKDSLTLSMPISKIDEEKRIVSGFATLDNIDRQNDKLLAEASIKAFEKFKGNVRLMHQPIPAGKLVSFRENTFFDPETKKTYTGIFVDAYISKGADNIWQMVLDGTLTGFSIGGKIIESEVMLEEEEEKAVRIVKDYELTELSLVDVPANQFANIFSIQKTDTGFVADGIFNKSNIQNVYWCENDKKAYLSENDSHSCIFCKSDTNQIGWIDELNPEDVAKAMSSIVKEHSLKKDVIATPPATAKNPVQGIPGGMPKKKIKRKVWKTEPGMAKQGDFVVYKKDKAIEKGRVKSIEYTGIYKNKMTGEKIVATKENPVAIISLYKELQNGKHAVTKRVTAVSANEVTRLKVKPFANQSLPETIWVSESVDEQWIQPKKGNKKESQKVMKKFLSTLFGKKEEIGLPVQEVLVEKTFKGDILQKSLEIETQGGVEMAENVNEGPLDNTEAEVTETVETEEVEFEIEEAIEEAVEASAEVVEKSVNPDEDETEEAEDASADVEISKALDDIKSHISDSIAKSLNSTTDSLTKVEQVIEGLAKAFDEKVDSLHKKYEELAKGLADVSGNISAVAERVESVENDTAIKKSGEFEGALPESPKMEKSVWGGRFLGTENIFN
jgi:uncharacterized protein YukE